MSVVDTPNTERGLCVPDILRPKPPQTGQLMLFFCASIPWSVAASSLTSGDGAIFQRVRAQLRGKSAVTGHKRPTYGLSLGSQQMASANVSSGGPPTGFSRPLMLYLREGHSKHTPPHFNRTVRSFCEEKYSSLPPEPGYKQEKTKTKKKNERAI